MQISSNVVRTLGNYIIPLNRMKLEKYRPGGFYDLYRPKNVQNRSNLIKIYYSYARATEIFAIIQSGPGRRQ